VAFTDQELAAQVAVSRILARCAHTADSGDGEGYAALFTEDGLIEGLPNGPFRGREEIARYYTGRKLDDPPRRHHVSTIDTWFDEAGVLRSRSYFSIVGSNLVAGVYEHEFARAGDDWLIKHKVTRIELRRPQ
jgi:uncharacterized protein (TIGR02246 family)